MALLDFSSPFRLSPRASPLAAAGIVAAIIAWFGGFLTGISPWLGVAWLARSTIGPTPIGETSAGTSLGVSTFLFFAGQDIVIDYDVDIRGGSLWFHVHQPFDSVLGDGVSHYVTASGRGEWTWRVPEAGIYAVSIEPSLIRGPGRGYDLAYTAWWGAR